MTEVKPFGVCELGSVEAIEVKDGELSFTALSYGATIQKLIVRDKDGAERDVVLGYDTLEEYRKGGAYLGAAIGRFGNRIANACFSLNGKKYHLAANNGAHSIHGGNVGFDKKLWKYETDELGVTFSAHLADGEEGFPGNMDVSIRYSIENGNALRIDYFAVSDQDTLANFTNHSYFNLNGAGSGSVEEQVLQLDAPAFTEVDEDLIPTGTLLPVLGTPFDFMKPKPIGQDLYEIELALTAGYDHNYCLSGIGLRKVGEAFAPASGIRMELSTTMEGVQLYTANHMNKIGKDGKEYHDHAAFCLETQHYPDAINHPTFRSCVLKAGEQLHETTIYRFTR